MVLKFIFIFLLSVETLYLPAQSLKSFADSIRIAYHIPELSYAVLSSDSVYELEALGHNKINSTHNATINDRFRIGSNTKAITGFIAAQLVKQGKIGWDTKFFDLFPELKKHARPEYYNLTLINLLSFRNSLIPYSYPNKKPGEHQFKGDENEQRRKFVLWALKQKPNPSGKEIRFSNMGYTVAAMMLEKVSGKTYKQLAHELGARLQMDIQFGDPNYIDTLQPWGHNNNLVPEPPANNYKLNWLLAAGNINVSIKDYAKFIQLQLKGLHGQSDLLSAQEFAFLHYGLLHFSVGWFWDVNKNGNGISYNTGNPGTFLSQVCVINEADRAYVILTNVQSDEAAKGISVLLEEMKARYGQ
jgi:CubicO group peptidase (beta-lactamase class C family)